MTNVDGVRLRDLLTTLNTQLSLGVAEALKETPVDAKAFILSRAIVALRVSVVRTEPFTVSIFNADAANRYHSSDRGRVEAEFRLRPRSR